MSKSSAAEYDAWHANLAVDNGANTPWHRLAAHLLGGTGSLNGQRVLEIACGRGGFSSWLAQGGALVTAADFSEVALEIAKAHFKDSTICWTVQDIQKMEFHDESFDVVISCETVEHVPDSVQAIHELARVLRPGGVLILTCPNYLGPLGLYRLYMRVTGRRYTEGGQPINRFTVVPRTISWVKQAGLTIEKLSARGHYLPCPGRPPISLEVLDRIPLLQLFALHSAIRARKRVKS